MLQSWGYSAVLEVLDGRVYASDESRVFVIDFRNPAAPIDMGGVGEGRVEGIALDSGLVYIVGFENYTSIHRFGPDFLPQSTQVPALEAWSAAVLASVLASVGWLGAHRRGRARAPLL